MGNNRYNNEYRTSAPRYADVSRMRERTLLMMGEDSFVDGNTVRRVANEAAPKYDEPEVNPKKKKSSEEKLNRRANRNAENKVTYREKTKCMNGLYAFVLAVAAVITLALCVRYLELQTTITEKTEYINSLKKDITTITSQNDAMDYSVNSYIDVEHVYKIATEELGMIMADENNVKVYESTEQEFMNQIMDIPKK
ncbi:MAG: hypothetical protein E7266_00125 [Lachnospiraceae bacterium]|nr:hypothetical protein [Lachnospiraceae bacterium]